MAALGNKPSKAAHSRGITLAPGPMLALIVLKEITGPDPSADIPLLSPGEIPTRPHVVCDEPIMRLTTMAAIPASTALAIGEDSISVIGFDPGAACS